MIKYKKLQQAITLLKNSEDVTQHDPEEIAKIFVEYYQKLLKKKDNREDIESDIYPK